jgi:hypothetical protein
MGRLAELRKELRWRLFFNGPSMEKLSVQSLQFFGIKGNSGVQMNYTSLAVAALGATIAYFAFGFLMFWLVPALINEAHKYPDVFRPKEKIMAVMLIGMVATLIAILVVATIFAMMTIHPGGSGAIEGARLNRDYTLSIRIVRTYLMLQP